MQLLTIFPHFTDQRCQAKRIQESGICNTKSTNRKKVKKKKTELERYVKESPRSLVAMAALAQWNKLNKLVRRLVHTTKVIINEMRECGVFTLIFGTSRVTYM